MVFWFSGHAIITHLSMASEKDKMPPVWISVVPATTVSGKQHFLQHSQSRFWDGGRLSFQDPSHYLSVSLKRPPGILFRGDQDISWSREEQRDEPARNVLGTLHDDIFGLNLRHWDEFSFRSGHLAGVALVLSPSVTFVFGPFPGDAFVSVMRPDSLVIVIRALGLPTAIIRYRLRLQFPKVLACCPRLVLCLDLIVFFFYHLFIFFSLSLFFFFSSFVFAQEV